MFFDGAREIPGIAGKVGCSVFVVPDEVKVEIKNAILVSPEGRTMIAIEQVREILGRLLVKQTSEMFVLIRPAEKMTEEAENALLKSLEEPKEKVHFVLVTSEPSKLLPTVLSRANVYFLRNSRPIDGEITAAAKVKETAKKLIVAKGAELVSLSEEINKKKERAYALEVVAVAIEMLYKSYYRTGKTAFVAKLPKFLKAYENVAANGHVKLHLVADLL